MQIISFQGHGKTKAQPVNQAKVHPNTVQHQPQPGAKPQMPKGHGADSFVRKPTP